MEPRQVPFEDLQTQSHMAHQLSARAVAEAPCSCKFLKLADVMEDCASYQQIRIEARIMLGQS